MPALKLSFQKLVSTTAALGLVLMTTGCSLFPGILAVNTPYSEPVPISTVEAAPTIEVRDTPPVPISTVTALPAAPAAQVAPVEPTAIIPLPVFLGEPAGCLSAVEQAGFESTAQMLAYADQLLDMPQPLSRRLLSGSWNEYTGQYDPAGDTVVSLLVDNVGNDFLIQDMLNALHVAGFVTWLRDNPRQGLHILALPLLDAQWQESAWAPYIAAYWQNRSSVPQGDETIVPALKLPPCAWMIEQGFASKRTNDWWLRQSGHWPDYAQAAAGYLAETSEDSAKVAGQIDWLGPEGKEGPNTMCGPLVWAILRDAGALPAGYGGWQQGARSFWLAKPRTNGRPWSLFPAENYQLFSFRQPLGEFDFSSFSLYPGDFLFTYSKGDGYDHMLVVTEVDKAGNVYTVTNRVQVHPTMKTTIERVLLLNLNDLSSGLARQAWHTDQKNGRTGHHGFDIFRWDWMEKDIQGQAVAYTIRPGDTLGGIAERWKTPAGWIAQYNGIDAGAVLRVGQEIRIPPNQNNGG